MLDDAFERVLSKQVIAPGNQIVDVLHDDPFHVRHRPVSCDQMRLKWVLTPLIDGRGRFIWLQAIQRLLQSLLGIQLFEREELPKPVFRRTVRHRVEDIVIPLHRLFEALRFAERIAEHHRRVKEQLPVINGIGALQFIVHIRGQWVGGIVTTEHVVSVERHILHLQIEAEELISVGHAAKQSRRIEQIELVEI